MKYIRVLKKFDRVVESCFGNELMKDEYEENIRAFTISFIALGISVTPKVHCVFRHVAEFCQRKGCGLGIYSEQVIEACHSDLWKIEQWYPTNLETDPNCDEKMLKKVSRYNGLRLLS